MGFKTAISAALCALAVTAKGAAACEAGDFELAMAAGGLQRTYDLFQERDVIDAILEGSSYTILAPSFEYSSGNDEDEQFTISQVDGILEDGEYTNVLLRGVLTTQYTYDGFTEIAPIGSPATTDSEFVPLSTLDLDVTLWFPSDTSTNIYFRSYILDGDSERVGIVSLVSTEAIDVCDGMYTVFSITGPLLTHQEAEQVGSALGTTVSE